MSASLTETGKSASGARGDSEGQALGQTLEISPLNNLKQMQWPLPDDIYPLASVLL